MRARAWWVVLVACGGEPKAEATGASEAETAPMTSTQPTTSAAPTSTTAPTTAGPGNAAPAAAIAADVLSGPPPLAVKFSGAGSSDPDGAIAAWQWDFGDGEVGAGPEVTHVYAAPGGFTATLTVVDDDGASDEAAVQGAVSGCPAYKAGSASHDLDAAALTEASGLALSRQSPGVLWTMNDSDPDGARLYAFATASGALIGTYALQGADVKDWEDLALGPGPVAGKEYLYVGDIGDNNVDRAGVTVYRALEPPVDPRGAGVMAAIGGVEALAYTYPGGQAHDAETMLVDPRTGDLYVVSKVAGAIAEVFHAPAPLAGGVLIKVAEADLGALGLATGGSVSAGGDWVVVRSYFSARMWRRAQGVPLWQAFAEPPCTVPLAMEVQGEAIGFAAEGLAYYTVSEGETPPLYMYEHS
jgi:PKD repeat protein